MTVSTYSRSQIILHWLIALAIAFNYLFSDGVSHAYRSFLRSGQAVSDIGATVHVYVGLAVIALVALRLVLRWVRGVPPAPATESELMRRVGEWTHLALYVLMLGVPVLGAVAWYMGITAVGQLHSLAANLILLVAGLHAAAALFHHYILRDGLLLRMVRF
ncbi:MAG: cytochrome b [Limimaricola sp.]|uniref:cytochrome b n=1 Tax=Limimaricola sp. TaxID=2211665 RepID=UPI001DCE224B|nr:cytochrome b/b6 domain-containing protein [Limimaricola sp.]MBI1417821.1 cytochrome b [Limimaricola sp.]